VIGQAPVPGAIVAPSSAVDLVISKGPQPSAEEGEVIVEGENEMVEGEGEPGDEGEGEGEDVTITEGEGEDVTLSEGEGEHMTPVEGEGEVTPTEGEGEAVTPFEGEGEPPDRDGVNVTEGEPEAPSPKVGCFAVDTRGASEAAAGDWMVLLLGLAAWRTPKGNFRRP